MGCLFAIICYFFAGTWFVGVSTMVSKMACKQKQLLSLTLNGDVISKSVKSFALSKRYTQAMVRAGILNILYRRLVLNKSDLKQRKYDEVSFMAIKSFTPKDPLLCKYLSWLKGIAESIDKNYLKEIFIIMKDPSNDEPVESYRFYLKYNVNDNQGNRHTAPEVKEATLALFQAIYDLGKCKKLVEETDVHLELTYYDITPDTYEPMGFERSEQYYCLAIPGCNNHLGTLKTGFHKLSCYAGGACFERPFTPIVADIMTMDEEEQKKQEAYEASTVEFGSDQEEGIKDVVDPKTSVSKMPEKIFNISNITVSDHVGNNVSLVSGQSDSVVMTEEYFNCICEITTSSNELSDIEIITCVACKRQYHAPCHGYLSKEDASQAVFTCIRCGTNDHILLNFNEVHRPLLAKVRLIIYFIEKFNRLPMNIINLLGESERKTTMEKLRDFELVTEEGEFNKTNQLVLKKVLPRLFIMDNSQLLI